MSALTDEEIFAAAIQKPAIERASFLERACAGDSRLRAQVESLLSAHDWPDSLLDAPACCAIVDADSGIKEGPGTRIGPYKLLQQIGEGGFGVVYMAEQQQPVRGKVALKIIKPGMDTKEVIARFESERQALALMDHANIAKVLDAGATKSGRPYFVMELVKGIPITKFCDDNHLPPEERLELFIQVCNALQHAHQKGIIHRDLKPSNVMVTMRDGCPVPKVIDFGVAKATSQTLTERTLFTAYGQMIGTPAYMSPEQAEMSCLDIDTRSDIYSLGVLLYELLTGTTPFEAKRLREAGYAEMQRIIREEDPPKPSTRVSTLHGPALSTLSQQCGVDERRLRGLFCGELDLIAMKALDKDREQRYESAAAFARDIRRYLTDEPVQACPPSALYRFQKYARKHRATFLTLTTVVTTMFAAAVVSTWWAVEANQARELADQRLLIANDAKDRAEANFWKALDAVDRLLTRVGDKTLNQVPQMEQVQKKVLQDAVDFYQGFLKEAPNDSHVRYKAAILNLRIGQVYKVFLDVQDSDRSTKTANTLLALLHSEDPTDRQVQADLAFSYWQLAVHGLNASDQETSLQRAVELLTPLIDDAARVAPDSVAADAGYFLPYVYATRGTVLTSHHRFQEAEEAYRHSLVLFGDSYEVAYPHRGLARLFVRMGQNTAAIEEFRDAIDHWRQRLDPSLKFQSEPNSIRGAVHLWLLNYENTDNVAIRRYLGEDLRDFGEALITANRCDEAILALQESIDVCARLARDFPTRPLYREALSMSYRELGHAFEKLGRTDEAQFAVHSSRLTDNEETSSSP